MAAGVLRIAMAAPYSRGWRGAPGGWGCVAVCLGFHSTTMCKVTAWEVREINNVTSHRLRCVCVRGIPDPVRAPALQHSGGRSDGLFGLPELGLSLVGSLQGRSAIHSCNSTVGHAWRGLNSLLWLALSWGLLGLVIYTTTDPLNS